MPGRQVGSDMNWSVVAICGATLGFMAAYGFCSALQKPEFADQVYRLFVWHKPPAEPPLPQALIVTANARDQITAIATLEPRGFHPLLANTADEVRAQIQANPDTLSIAVVDAALPDYAEIAQALREVLPVGSVVVLKKSRRPQDLGPMLLERLSQRAAAGPHASCAECARRAAPTTARERSHRGTIFSSVTTSL